MIRLIMMCIFYSRNISRLLALAAFQEKRSSAIMKFAREFFHRLGLFRR